MDLFILLNAHLHFTMCQYFLVNTGIVTLPRSATGTDGSIYNIDYPITDYKLIKKEDYWNSVPNYLSFDLTQLLSNNQF